MTDPQMSRKSEPVPLGTFRPFYRHTPLPSNWLRDMPVIEGESELPDYLFANSFPYRRRDPREGLFVNGYNAVRLLGGWDKRYAGNVIDDSTEPGQFDLAYRAGDGRIQYRWGLLKERLDPLQKNGFLENSTLVLDNVPWCFPENPGPGPFGQVQPPADRREWREFVSALCRQLVELYGAGSANKLRFRLGTECQGSAGKTGHNRFDGSEARFLEHYRDSALAVKEVLPDARFGPFNLAGLDQGLDKHLINYRHIAEYCVEQDLPFDFVAHSLYYVPLFGYRSPLAGIDPVRDHDKVSNCDPDEKTRYYTDFWNDLRSLHPRFRDVPYEMHEYGTLTNELGLPGHDSEARFAAQHFHTIVNLLEGGLTGMDHWGLLKGFPYHREFQCLNGLGWLFMVFDHLAGGDAYGVPLPDSSTVNTRYRCLAVALPDEVVLVLSAFNIYRHIHVPESVTVQLPDCLGPVAPETAQIASLSDANSPTKAFRDDLARANLLPDDYALHPDVMPFAPRKELVTDPAAATDLAKRNADRYEQMLRSSLTLAPFDGVLREDGGATELELRLRPPEVAVMVVRRSR
ncbi:MAG: hypothetical protein HN742_25715 [Lentisphaerae bacterium]|nr:hypothetical protein [Lentisphaerota bacterium]MBT4814418.1 hypothetical protein [Lentisphaerota bacterium]MBT7056028.1 hypothetical protein [Lentisphaerota bacterium]MBT7845298.1 hypothetical protein [Lentisphaerota bacterium]